MSNSVKAVVRIVATCSGADPLAIVEEMQTLGIDLAAEPKKTGVPWVDWSDAMARVSNLHVGASDEELLKSMAEASKSGIDCPLGWPRRFVAFITKHQDDHVAVEGGVAADWRRKLAYRETDLYVRRAVPGIQGLSVSTDRIGVTTMRCAALLSRLAAQGLPVARTGVGPVAEARCIAGSVGFQPQGLQGPKGAYPSRPAGGRVAASCALVGPGRTRNGLQEVR